MTIERLLLQIHLQAEFVLLATSACCQLSANCVNIISHRSIMILLYREVLLIFHKYVIYKANYPVWVPIFV
jgi:hypothetical protein